MSLQINRSFAAISAGALQSYHTNQTTMGKSITRVSTGKRVNTAADDVGAYASSRRIKADSAAYNALYRGVQSGATYLNAADKAMTSIVDMLTAMREKALEYHTTDNDAQQKVLKNEFSALYDAAKTAVYTKVGTNDSMLTDGATFSFVTGLQASSAEEVDLSNAPSDVKTFTATSEYTFDDLKKSSISFYQSATTESAGTLVIADNTYTLAEASSTQKLTDLGGSDVGVWYAIKDTASNVVGAYNSSTGAFNWDIQSFKASNTSANFTFKTIDDINITSVKDSSTYNSATFNVTAASFNPTTGGKINIDGVELTLTTQTGKSSDTFAITGTIYSGTTDAVINGNWANYNSTVTDQHVGHYKFDDKTGQLIIEFDQNAKYLVDGVNKAQSSTGVHFVGSTNGDNYFGSGTTHTYSLMRDFTTSKKPDAFTIQENTLDYDANSGTIVVSKDVTGNLTTYNLSTDNYVYDADDTETALGSWKVDSEGNLNIKWGNPETAALSFSVDWDGIQSYLQDSDKKDFDITSKDAAEKLATAISNITDEQSKIGGGINALEYVSEHLSNLASVQDEAYTTLTEADMAAEMTNYVKSNIYSQAAQAMIAQANQSLAQVLNLLQ